MKLRRLTIICMVAVTTAANASIAGARQHIGLGLVMIQGQPVGGPLSKDRLLKLLKLNASSPQELVQIVARKGVDFQPSADDEKEFRQAGASDDLIAAVRANFKGAAAANNATTENTAPQNQPVNVQPPATSDQTNQAVSVPITPQTQPAQNQAPAGPQVGFHGYQVGSYKGDAKDRQYTQKLEFKIDSIDEKTGAVHAQFYGSQSYRAWDLNGKIDEDGVLRLEGRISGPNSQIIGHIDGGTMTGKYRIADLNGVDGEFTVKFTPDDFADEFNKKPTKSKPNN